MNREPYQTDLNDDQWRRVEAVIGDLDSPRRGRPKVHTLREVVNALAYRWATGISWRLMPHDFPPWTSVYSYHKQWRRDGRLFEIRAALMQRETVLETIARERSA